MERKQARRETEERDKVSLRHLHGGNSALENTAADANIAGERALLVDKVTLERLHRKQCSRGQSI
jgi:hypothetical protein